MLTFMKGRETATLTPPFFLRIEPGKSGIEIKGKPKKKWQMATRKKYFVNKISDGDLSPSRQGTFSIQLREWNQGCINRSIIFGKRRHLIQSSGS